MTKITADTPLWTTLPRMAGSIHVCPLSAVPDVVAGCNASHLVTCLQDEIVVETPALIKPELHVRLHVDDIAQPIPGHVAPDAEHIDRLLEFALAWGGQGPMVIHCWAGISRSTAAALISLARAEPGRPRGADRAAPARGLAYRLSQPPHDPPRRRRLGPQGPHGRSRGVDRPRRRRRRGAAVLASGRSFPPAARLGRVPINVSRSTARTALNRRAHRGWPGRTSPATSRGGSLCCRRRP